MTTDTRKRYIPPPSGEILPTSFYCVPVRIPANEHYLRCFLQSLDYFAKWVAWENAPGVQASEIATLWKTANEITRSLMVEGGCYANDPQYDATLPDGRPPALGTIDDMLWYLRNIGSDIITRLNNAEECADITAYWRARLLDQLEVLVTTQLDALCTSLAAMTFQQQTDFLDIAHWQSVREEMYCRYLNQEITYDEYQNWLEWLSDQISISLNTASEWLIDTLNDVAEIITGTSGSGLDRAARQSDGAGGGFGGTTMVCTIYRRWNAVNGWEGWYPYDNDPAYGSLVAGVWQNGQSPDNYKALVLLSPNLGEDFTITGATFRYTITGNEPPFGQQRIQWIDSLGIYHNYAAIDYSPGVYEIETGELTARQIYFDLEVQLATWTATLTEVEFVMENSDPFP